MSPIQAFDCRMCGHCCEGAGGIVLAEKDKQRLAEHLGLSIKDMLARYAEQRGNKHMLVTGADNYCIFFKDGKGCEVHPGRPDICRAWPFFKGNLIDEGSWEMIQTDCPGVCNEAGHAEFRKQGLAYVSNLQVNPDDPDSAEALIRLPKE